MLAEIPLACPLLRTKKKRFLAIFKSQLYIPFHQRMNPSLSTLTPTLAFTNAHFMSSLALVPDKYYKSAKPVWNKLYKAKTNMNFTSIIYLFTWIFSYATKNGVLQQPKKCKYCPFDHCYTTKCFSFYRTLGRQKNVNRFTFSSKFTFICLIEKERYSRANIQYIFRVGWNLVRCLDNIVFKCFKKRMLNLYVCLHVELCPNRWYSNEFNTLEIYNKNEKKIGKRM